MSERNLGLFLPGHVPEASLLAALEGAPGITPEALFAEGPARVGYGRRAGRPYTHLALPIFENSGFALLGHTELPGDDDLEMYLGRALSAQHGQVLMLQYDDETGWGGFVLFGGGELVDREAIDGRELDAVRRRLEEEELLDDLDPSDWIWPLLGAAVERGAAAVLGGGVDSDDAIASLIAGAGTPPASPPLAGAAPRQVRAQDAGDAGRLRRLLHRLRRRS